MAFTQQFNTNALLTLLNQSVAGGGPITITSVQVGSGFPASGDNPENYTGLKNLVQTLGAITSPSKLSGISSINATVLYQTTVRFQVSSQDAPLTYQWNEYGIFAKVGAGSPVLICYVTTGAATGDTVTPSGTGIPLIKQNATVINYSLSATTTTNLTLTNTVDLHASTHLDNGPDPIPLATTARTGSLRQLQGTINYYLAGDGTWQPITPLITVSTTLYVDPSYNNVVPYFSSIANAMNYLNGYQLANGVSIKILVNDAVYPTAATLNLQHLNGQQISIQAANNAPDVSFTVGTITGSAYAWSVQLTGVSSVANIKVGTYLNIWRVATPNPAGFLLTGCFRVTAVSGTTVTILVPYHGSSFPATGASSGYASPLNVILSMSQNQSVTVGDHGLYFFGGLAIVCNQAPSVAIGFIALSITGNIALSKIGVSGFIPSNGWTTSGIYEGIELSGGTASAYKTCSTGNGYGWVCSGSANVNLMLCAGTHNAVGGVRLLNSHVAAACDSVTPSGSICYSYALGNGSNGWEVDSTSVLTGGGGWVSGAVAYGAFVSMYNGGWGVLVQEGSITNSYTNSDINGSNGCYVSSSNNGSGDLAVTSLSVADLMMVGSRIFNQVSGTLTSNGIINV